MSGPFPVGAVLAGGRGRRLGGAKASVELCGKPLLAYPLRALSEALDEVVVVAKASTELPRLPGMRIWLDHSEHQHPLVGLTAALQSAGGRGVVVCALDLPLVTGTLVKRFLDEELDAPAVIASHRGQPQPLLGRYGPAALAPLSSAPSSASLRAAVMALGPRLLEVGDAELLLNVNTRADLRCAARLLSRRSRTSSAPAG